MTDVRCEACGYGVATRVPQACPMCGGAVWTPSTGRRASAAVTGRPAAAGLAHTTPPIGVELTGVRSLPRGAALLLRLGARVRGAGERCARRAAGMRPAGGREVAIGRGRAPSGLHGPAGRAFRH